LKNAHSKIICYHFGSGGKIATDVKKGLGTIWMDDVSCVGNEILLSNCNFAGWNNHNCNHNEDAGVICESGNLKQDVL